ncbi:MAG: PilX N-terminal domain-containing pilus assembly protein [Proteobacteria bacterium]|nr:PilX N-terminal domain-containing pilus assembly protein [Pseudomonadota bacterium]
MNQPQNFNLKRTGQGVVLIFSLVFLLVLTMLGVSVVGTTTSEEKMSRNFRDSLVAQSAAEAALRDAEIRLTGYYTDPPTRLNGFFDENCTRGLCDQSVALSSSLPVYGVYTMTGTPAVALGGNVCGGSTAVTGAVTGSPLMVIPGLTQPVQPCYLIEQLPSAMPGESASSVSSYYRITAVGWGRNPTTQVTLQEEFIP